MVQRLSVSCALLVTACAVALLPTQLWAQKAAPERPIGGGGYGMGVVHPDPVNFPGLYIVQDEGNASHLGKFQRTKYVQFIDAAGVDFVGVVEFTAANGDMLFADMIGQYDHAGNFVTGSYEFTGGTGRFHNATGSAEFHGDLDIIVLWESFYVDSTFVGRIRY